MFKKDSKAQIGRNLLSELTSKKELLIFNVELEYLYYRIILKIEIKFKIIQGPIIQ